MIHLAPIGLETSKYSSKDRHLPLQNQVLAAVQRCKQASPGTIYTTRDPLTRDLLKALDAFFCHGFVIPPKCYWRYVREFLPQSIQHSLALEWNARTERGLSVAWLKNAINQQSLHFQMLAFVSQPKVTAKFYDKNAAIRNIPVLKRIAVGVEDLGAVQFRIENTVQRRQYDAPVAQLSSQTPVVHVPSSSAIETRSFIKNKALQSVAANIRDTGGDIILSASFQHGDGEYMYRFPGHRSAADLATDLPRVEVPSTAHEPFLSTTRDQDYMINEIVKTHRVRVQSRTNPTISSASSSAASSPQLDDNSESEAPLTNETNNKFASSAQTRKRLSPPNESTTTTRNGAGNARTTRNPFEDDDSSSFSTTSTDDETERSKPLQTHGKLMNTLDLDKPIVSLHEELNSTSFAPINVQQPEPSSNVSPWNSAELNSPATTENIDGDIALSSGEIIQMAISVFREDVENFQKLFAVYVDHAVGQPKRRFLLLTDLYLYVLSATTLATSGEPIQRLSRVDELAYLSSTPAMDSCSFDLDEPQSQTAESLRMNYHTEVELPLSDIDCISLGVDAQSVSICTKKYRFKAATSDHEQKQFVVETASKQLGDLIASTIQRIVRKYTPKHNDIAIGSGLTMYSIILRNFVRRELGLPSVDLKHGVLVYWLQSTLEDQQALRALEGYHYTRNFYPKAWRRKADKWTQSYFMLSGSKLYRFTDSTCKTGDLVLNIRESVEEVVEVDLKADEKFVLELRFTDASNPNMQLSFDTLDEMKKWMKSLSMILSTAIQDKLTPVSCAVILTDTAVLFAQEGANCQVDGFMRLLLQISFRDIAALASLNMIRHHLLILRRESGASEVIFLRNEAELQRLCNSFATFWQLNVEELSESSAQADPAYSRVYLQCCHMEDVWSITNSEDQHAAIERQSFI